MKKLAHIIHDTMQEGPWNPIKAGKNGPQISHLMFANDLLHFKEASEIQIRTIKDMLQIFYDMSRQKVNTSKYCIFLSKNVKNDLKQRTTEISGFSSANDLGMYLGIPLFHRRAT